MISDRVRDLLIEQVGHELSAHQAYYGISLYFEGQSLKKWARLFHGQSVEEAQHATKIISYLVDNEVPFELPAIGAGTTKYSSAKAAVQAALDSEIRVTGQFNALAAACSSSSGSSRSRSRRSARCAIYSA
jgi:ferritin